MYKRVDIDHDVIEGFSYLNKHEEEEFVEMEAICARIHIDDITQCVYYEDIPKLIKALQAAYDYTKEQNYV